MSNFWFNLNECVTDLISISTKKYIGSMLVRKITNKCWKMAIRFLYRFRNVARYI